MASYNNLVLKFFKWETGYYFNKDLSLRKNYELAKEKNRKVTAGTFTRKGDRGGMTVLGITLKSFISYQRAKGVYKSEEEFSKDLADMDFATWFAIFHSKYWKPWQADRIANDSIAELLVDWGWGSGVLNAIMRTQRLFGLKDDGIVGPKTLAVINANDPSTIHAKIMKARIAYIHAIVKKNPSQAKYEKGWLKRITSFVYAPNTDYIGGSSAGRL